MEEIKDRVDAVSSAALEMVELLILVVQLLQDSLARKAVETENIVAGFG